MSYQNRTDFQKLSEVMGPVDVVLSLDLEGLRRRDERERAELLNRVIRSQNNFQNEFLSGLAQDLRQELGSRYTMARLLLAAAADANGEYNPILDDFNRTELDLVQDFERFNIFDVLKPDEIVQRIAWEEDIYDLIIEFYKKEYSKLDNILENPGIQRDLKICIGCIEPTGTVLLSLWIF